jgi:beta-lactamase class A
VVSGSKADSREVSKGYSRRAIARAAMVTGLLTLSVGPSNATPAPAPRLQASAPAPRPLPPEVVRARAVLDARLASLGRAFGGQVGLAVRDVQTGWTSAYNGSAPMPQQSVSKFWVALTALEKVDRRELDLNKQVVITRSDLTLFHQPIAQFVRGDGYKTTLSDLMFRALTQSDNTANDAVLRSAGGPDAVRSFLARHNIQGVRFGPGERLLQSQTAGLSWRQEYAIGRAFEAARSALPMKLRQAALERYLADPMDGATAIGLVDGLTKLKRGQLLSPASTQRLLQIMSNTKTGPQRLKGGLEPGWTCAHKTGTGQNLGGTTAGFNDVGIITSPDGQSYAVAVMIGRTSRGIPERWKLMNETVRAIIDYHRNVQTA